MSKSDSKKSSGAVVKMTEAIAEGLAEADFFISQNLHEEAVELLENLLKEEGNHPAITAKIYEARVDPEAVEDDFDDDATILWEPSKEELEMMRRASKKTLPPKIFPKQNIKKEVPDSSAAEPADPAPAQSDPSEMEVQPVIGADPAPAQSDRSGSEHKGVSAIDVEIASHGIKNPDPQLITGGTNASDIMENIPPEDEDQDWPLDDEAKHPNVLLIMFLLAGALVLFAAALFFVFSRSQ